MNLFEITDIVSEIYKYVVPSSSHNFRLINKTTNNIYFKKYGGYIDMCDNNAQAVYSSNVLVNFNFPTEYAKIDNIIVKVNKYTFTDFTISGEDFNFYDMLKPFVKMNKKLRNKLNKKINDEIELIPYYEKIEELKFIELTTEKYNNNEIVTNFGQKEKIFYKKILKFFKPIINTNDTLIYYNNFWNKKEYPYLFIVTKISKPFGLIGKKTKIKIKLLQ